ncbi:CHAD domain-containing protein [Haliea sp. E1-2-M8]|uniref:CHAD domain-containing protein n=1 Tax=Haliea sp. E1-2-M8 TaxID=3064706 RepID=UPI0027233C44|nr:CHAD domain-containing protein [Haliea sp. E1-2-M8]MDO8861036.1 CHAD domain-containing protein [Haliea sp. E1-2-M8]
MSFKFEIGESAGDGIRRMAREQMDKALAEIVDSGLDRHGTVHQLRKRCKKIRALLRLARGDLDNGCQVYKRENDCFRDAARSLSYVRDAEALLETYDRLIDTFAKQSNRQRLKKVRDVLEERKRKVVEDGIGLDGRIEAFAATILEARKRAGDWPIGDGFDSLAPGLQETYARGRKAMKRVADKPGTENFHQWRKRVKYHLYHVRVLRPIWDDVLDEWRDALEDLGDDLGDDHDLAVFGKTLSEEQERFESNRDLQALLGLSDRRRAQLQARAFPLGQRLFAEKPRHLVRRFEAYWEASLADVKRGSSMMEADAKVPADD